MIQPINYYQTDTRWAKKKYGPKGNSRMTIGSSGCGPTCAAMVIQSIKNNGITPVDTCQWSMNHGMVASVGTYWSYFNAQFKEYDIKCKQTTNKSEAFQALKKGDWVICIMHKGNWTSGGHFILAYGYEDKYVFINDPNSTLKHRTYAKWSLLTSECNGYWIITVPEDIKKNGIKPEREKSVLEMYVSSTTGLKVRTGASVLHKVVRKAAFNEEVHITATKGEWGMIGKGEWVNMKYLSKYQSIEKQYITNQQLNVRDGYTTKNTKIIGKVKKGTKITITKIRNNWGYSEKYKGWICLKGETKEYCTEVK